MRIETNNLVPKQYIKRLIKAVPADVRREVHAVRFVVPGPPVLKLANEKVIGSYGRVPLISDSTREIIAEIGKEKEVWIYLQQFWENQRGQRPYYLVAWQRLCLTILHEIGHARNRLIYNLPANVLKLSPEENEFDEREAELFAIMTLVKAYRKRRYCVPPPRELGFLHEAQRRYSRCPRAPREYLALDQRLAELDCIMTAEDLTPKIAADLGENPSSILPRVIASARELGLGRDIEFEGRTLLALNFFEAERIIKHFQASPLRLVIPPENIANREPVFIAPAIPVKRR